MTIAQDGPATTGRGLEIENLVVGYGKAIVLHGLSLRVAPGEIVGVAGPNGAGKSTLLKVISGLLPRTADRMTFDGVPLKRDPVAVVGRGVVHVPEGRRMFANLTVEENLKVGAIGGRVRDYRAARERVLALLPTIVPMLGRKAGLLSGGQQQQVAVARGLIANPSLLMVDELSLGLSPSAVASISASTVATCRELGTGLLWVDQNITILAKHCDRLVLLRDGVAEPVDMSDRDALGSVYF
ncbi:MAG: ATP-binding cassette domain-containing protein [Microbacteriaceae bacterium]|nr:ATP-binding cassette domain-containing protein [Microbacteriaceae bacterium]